MSSRPGQDTDAASVAIDPQRLEPLFRVRRQRLHEAADRTYLSLLPVQWLLSSALCIIQVSLRVHTACAAPLGVFSGLLVASAVHLAPAWLITRHPGTTLSRGAVAASQIALFAFLLLVSGGEFDARLFAFVSLAFLTFYREWTLLVIVASADVVVQFWYGQMMCADGSAAAAQTIGSWLEFVAWVSLECAVLAVVCTRGKQLLLTNARAAALLETERGQAALEREQYRAVLESTSAVPWELDRNSGRCTYIGGQVKSQWGWDPASFQEEGFFYRCLSPEDREAFARALERAVTSHDVVVECRMTLASGVVAHIRSFIRHATTEIATSKVRGISMDITAQKKLEVELQQAQRLESIGRLAAGIAHEINTPVQFVGDNCHFLHDSMRELTSVLGTYRQCLGQVAAGHIAGTEALSRVEAAERAVDVEFLIENIPLATTRSLEGLDRVATIVRAMKEFSHPGDAAPVEADINAALASTLIVCKNEYKYVADVETTFGNILPVSCYIGALNQAFLNIIVNAAHAIGEANSGTERRGLISISTRLEADYVVIAIRDTGGGISEENRTKVFDPFFTTKEVGKGTGQGLAIARSVVVDRHGGTLQFETCPGVGTTFFIRLPIATVAKE